MMSEGDAERERSRDAINELRQEAIEAGAEGVAPPENTVAPVGLGRTCPAPGCEEDVDPSRFACYPHWRKLPTVHKREVGSTWTRRLQALRRRQGNFGDPILRRAYDEAVTAHETAKDAATRWLEEHA